MKRLASILLFTVLALPTPRISAEGYNVEELRDENSTSSPLFSIARVAPYSGGLRLFLSTPTPDVVALLLTSGALAAQFSDHAAETESPVTLSLGKAVWCTEESEPLYLGYAEPIPACGGQPPAKIEYYFEASITLGTNRDLAIGQDPDFLWLIEEK
jgi:hypothetical protein